MNLKYSIVQVLANNSRLERFFTCVILTLHARPVRKTKFVLSQNDYLGED